jgi:hypothetical protein
LSDVKVTDPTLGDLLYGDSDHVFCTIALLPSVAPGNVHTCSVEGPTPAIFTGTNREENTACVEGTFTDVASIVHRTGDCDTAWYRSAYWAFTPGFWKNHGPDAPSGHNAWLVTDYVPTQAVDSVFSGPNLSYKPKGKDFRPRTFGELTLMEALSLKGGKNTAGATEILLRAGTAALLNTSFHEHCGHGDGYYPMTKQEVIDAVNGALSTSDREEILAVASMLDLYNNTGIHYIDWDNPCAPMPMP